MHVTSPEALPRTYQKKRMPNRAVQISFRSNGRPVTFNSNHDQLLALGVCPMRAEKLPQSICASKNPVERMHHVDTNPSRRRAPSGLTSSTYLLHWSIASRCKAALDTHMPYVKKLRLPGKAHSVSTLCIESDF